MGAKGLASWAAGVSASLSLPLGPMCFCPSEPTWEPGVGDSASYGQRPLGRLRPAGTRCPQVQDVVKCQMGVCRADESEDSPDSCKNGQLQILVSEEAWAGHGWVLSIPPPPFPCPRPLPFPHPWQGGDRDQV